MVQQVPPVENEGLVVVVVGVGVYVCVIGEWVGELMRACWSW